MHAWRYAPRLAGHDRWNDETVWNYEAGMKSRLAGGRASLNLAAFYMDIKDLQLKPHGRFVFVATRL